MMDANILVDKKISHVMDANILEDSLLSHMMDANIFEDNGMSHDMDAKLISLRITPSTTRFVHDGWPLEVNFCRK